MSGGHRPPDWKIVNFDAATTEAPETETELKRLTALKAYGLLGQDDANVTDPAYQQVVNYMSNAFGGTACLNLVDLERVWTVASSNAAAHLVVEQQQQQREQRRKDCFCAHTVLLKSHLQTLVVPNAEADARFRLAPSVMGPPYTRFYAGAPLITSDGFRIGTLSITDTQARTTTNTWTEQQSELLTQLATITVQHMDQKQQQQQQQQSQPQQPQQPPPPKQPPSSHEETTSASGGGDATESGPPSGSSLGAISDASVPVEPFLSSTPSGDDNNNKDEFTDYTALFQDFDHPHRQDDDAEPATIDNNPSSSSSTAATATAAIPGNNNSSLLGNSKFRMLGKETPVQIRVFVNLLEEVMESVPKKVHLLFIVDPKLPTTLILHDAIVFRAVLAMLSSACERTVRGQICLTVYARPGSRRGPQQPDLVFECEDTGPNLLLVDSNDNAWAAADAHLQTLPAHAATLAPQADCGFRPRVLAHGGTGSTLWFSVPLRRPAAAATSGGEGGS